MNQNSTGSNSEEEVSFMSVPSSDLLGRSLMIVGGINPDQYDSHCSPPTHVVSLSTDRHCMKLLENPCTMSTLFGGATARPSKVMYNSLHNTMYIHTAPEHRLKLLVISGLE